MLAFSCVVGGGAGAGVATTAFAAGSFGYVLNSLQDHLNQVIDHATNTGLVLETEAGAQASALIAQTKAAYEDELNKTVTALSAQQQQAIAGIQSIIDGIEHSTFASLAEAEAKAQAIVNTLPFSNRYPQVTVYKGIVAVPGQDHYDVEVDGNFYEVAAPGLEPSVALRDHKLTPTETSTTRLVFRVQGSDLHFDDHRVSYESLVLTVPHKQRCKLVFDCDARSNFRFMLVLLPPTPGAIEVQYTTTGSQRVSEDHTAGGLIWDSSQDDIDRVQCGPVESGWNVDWSSVNYHLSREEGDKGDDWFDLGNSTQGNQACWHFKTLHKGMGTSGKLTVELHYRVWKDVSTTAPHVDHPDPPLRWGESRVVQVPAGVPWTARYTQFDGAVHEYATSDASNPYVHVRVAGPAVEFLSAPF